MRRISNCLLVVAWLLLCSPLVRADIVVGTVDFFGNTPLGISRFDETLQAGPATALTAGDVLPFSVPISEQLSLPFKVSDVAVAPNGDLYSSDLAGQILRVDGTTGEPVPSPIPMVPDGLFTGYFTSFGDNLTFASLSFGPSGRLYVVDSYDTDSDNSTLTPGIRVYDTTTTLQVDTLFDELGPGVGPLSTLLSSVAFTPDGNLLLSDLGGGKIYHADITTTPGQEVVTELVTTIDIDGMAGADNFNPSGMAIDSNGSIYVANMSGNNIVKFNSDGSGATQVATIRPTDPPTVPSSFFGTLTHHPTDIAFDRDGNLLVTVLGDKNVTYVDDVLQPTNGGIFRYDTSGNLLQTVADDLLPVSGIALIDDLLPADYDGSGVVDAGDYAAWKSQFGDAVQPTTGADGNGDGVVNLADYTIWRDAVGASGIAPSFGALGTSVPEPSSLLLAAAVLLVAFGGWDKPHRSFFR